MLKLPFVLIVLAGAGYAQDEHHAGVNQRGDHVMGFSHEKTTHRFELRKDGGSVAVRANDPKDTQTRDQIRGHLPHIVQMFSAGDFHAPMLIHAQNPPGSAAMARLKDQIHYSYQDTAAGGEVKIASANKAAISAIHEFLRFQIKDHQTGDSLDIK
jgi:hypothetical protein